MFDNKGVLCGFYSAGSYGMSTFSAEWGSDTSALRSIAAMGKDAVVFTDSTIVMRGPNASLAKKLGIRILQGWIVLTTTSEGKRVFLVLFPLDAEMEKVFCRWSRKYPREKQNTMDELPFGEVMRTSLYTHVPFNEIEKYCKLLCVFGLLQGAAAIANCSDVMDYCDGFFVEMTSGKEVVDELMYLKRVCGNRKLISHFGVGGCSYKETACLRNMIDTTGMFPLPSSVSYGDNTIVEYAKIMGLLDSPMELFEWLPEIDVTAVLIPGANVSNDYGCVERLPYELRLSDAEADKLFDEMRMICERKIRELYDGEMSDYAKELFGEELILLREVKAYHFVKVLLLLHDIFKNEPKKCIILKDGSVRTIAFLMGLSRFNPIEEAFGNCNLSLEDIKMYDYIDIEISPETFDFLVERINEIKPEQVSLLGDDVTVGDYIATRKELLQGELLNTLNNLTSDERQRLESAVISVRADNEKYANILIAADGVVLPVIKAEGEALPVLTRTFYNMASGSILFSVHINISKTLSRYEAVDEMLLRYMPRVSKSVENQLYRRFAKLDKTLSAGIEMLTPLLCERLKEESVSSGYEVAITMLKYNPNAGRKDFPYYLQWTHIILQMLLGALAYPQVYYECISPRDTMLDSYSEELLEAMLFDPELKEERTEQLLIDNDIYIMEYLMAASAREDVQICYAKSKRQYPVIIIDS